VVVFGFSQTRSRGRVRLESLTHGLRARETRRRHASHFALNGSRTTWSMTRFHAHSGECGYEAAMSATRGVYQRPSATKSGTGPVDETLTCFGDWGCVRGPLYHMVF
jgi:hypothetical protein